MKVPGNLDTWVRTLIAIAGWIMAIVGGALLNRQPTGPLTSLGLLLAVAGMALLVLLAFTDQRHSGDAPKRFIDSGEYRVHMLRPDGNKVAVVVVRSRCWGDKPLEFYLLPRVLFDQPPEPFVNATAMIIMRVRWSPSGERIQLSHKVQMRIVTASTQKDPA